MACLNDFPSEVLHQITGYFEYKIDLHALSQTSRRFSLIANERLYNNLRQGRYSADDLFIWALENGKEACVRRFIQAEIPVPLQLNSRTNHPIFIAAEKGYANIVRVLLEYEVNPGSLHWILRQPVDNPLTVATQSGHESVVKVLIEYGVNLEYAREFDLEERITQPLCIAVKRRRVSLVRLLLDHGCNPLTPDYDYDGLRMECAWEAAAGTDIEILRMFINKGFEPDFSDPEYSYLSRHLEVLLEALRTGDTSLVRFLFTHAAELDPDALDYNDSYRGMLLRALHSGHISTVKFLFSLDAELQVLPDPCDDDFSRVRQDDILHAISYAAGKCPLDAEFLLHKANVNKLIQEKSLRPIVCLMVGAANGGNEELMKRLLDIDWSQIVEAEDWRTHLTSCLVIAACLGYYGLAKLLLDYGADPRGVVKDKQSQRGNIPPIYAAAEKGSVDIVRLLLDRGADPFPQQQFTLLEKVFRHKQTSTEMVRLLLERDILVPKGEDSSRLLVYAINGGAEIFQLVLQHIGGELQANNDYHREAFEVSVRMAETTIMEIFLKAGFDPNSNHVTKQTSFLALAAEVTDPPGIGEQAVDLLLKYGADLEWCDSRSNRPLQYCLDKPEALRLLLKKGANPLGYRDSSCGYTLLNATRWGETSTVKALLQSFDVQDIPFEKAGPVVEEAINDKKRQGRNPKASEYLWRWYYRRVYACQGKPYVLY
jgi:ankyrin repeat protein